MRNVRCGRMMGLAMLACATAMGQSPVIDGDAAAIEPTVSSLISSHMVLQREVALPIRGTAAPGTPVRVTFDGEAWTAQADDEGRWVAMLPAQQAGGPHTLTVTIGQGDAVTYQDILIGDVWVCSGQSNMQWPVARSKDAAGEIAAADHPGIRLFTVAHHPSALQVQTRVRGVWRVCSPQSVRSFSAVGYFFGRQLHQELDVPIGLICNAVGAMPAETYTSRRTLESDPELASIVQRFDHAVQAYDEAYEKWQAEVAAYEQAMRDRQPDDPTPRRPPEPMGPNSPSAPAALWRGMTVPLGDLPIRGVIWYQGESNAWQAAMYRKLFPMLIEDWRRLWNQPEMPFLFVQLANFYREQTDPNERSAWAELREAQLQTLRVPHTALAVAIDVGEADDIHPQDKQSVGHRLALAALARVYDRDIIHSGPIYRQMIIEGDAIRLMFDHVGSGLVTHGPELHGFAIAGEDRVFHFAQATIEGDTVRVRSDQVPQPVAVRYGWANNPPVNLYNREGLPASPFRTDDWPRR